jgi:hypothetical protein
VCSRKFAMLATRCGYSTRRAATAVVGAMRFAITAFRGSITHADLMCIDDRSLQRSAAVLDDIAR